MTRHDFFTKWAIYTLALLPIWWLEVYVLNRFPVFGVAPMLLPVAAVTVAVLEGPAGGAGFGLLVGVLCDAVYFGSNGSMTLFIPLIGWAAGAAAAYVLDRTFLGCVLCAALGLLTIAAGRVGLRLFLGVAPLPALLRVAVPELVWSLCFTLPIYPFFAMINRKITGMLRL